VPAIFDLTVMRRASQGFFDVAVTFDDIFCSAKLDCVDALLHDPATDQRGPTANIAFACTAGTGQDTTLYWGDAAVVCRDDGGEIRETYTVNPSQTPGQHGPILSSLGQPDLYESAIYRGREQLLGLDKCFWNMAIGLDAAALGSHCTFEATATAAASPFPTGRTPDDTVYPVIRWAVPLTGDAPTLVCGQNPLDGPGSWVTTAYTTLSGLPFELAWACADAGTTDPDDPPDDPVDPDDPPVDPEAPPVTFAVNAVDQAGVALPAMTFAPATGAGALLPLSFTTPGNTALAGKVLACGGELPLPAGVIPRPHVSLTVTLPNGPVTSAQTPGVSAVTLVIPQHKPGVWWRFEADKPFGTDSVYNWVCNNYPNVSRAVPAPNGGVGQAVDLNRLPFPFQIQCYARLTGALPFQSDARLPQRAWLASGSFTVEAMFENTHLLEQGMNARPFILSSRMSLHFYDSSFRVNVIYGGATYIYRFYLDGVGVQSNYPYYAGWHHIAVTYDKPTGDLKLWLDGINPDGFVAHLPPGTQLGTATNVFLGGGQYSPFDGNLDEVAGFDGALSPGLIYQHARDALDLGRPYGVCERPQVLPPTALEDPNVGGMDPRNMPPGYPNFDAQGTNPAAKTPLAQLASYPLPRYAPDSTLPPMSSWMGARYLAGQGRGRTQVTREARREAPRRGREERAADRPDRAREAEGARRGAHGLHPVGGDRGDRLERDKRAQPELRGEGAHAVDRRVRPDVRHLRAHRAHREGRRCRGAPGRARRSGPVGRQDHPLVMPVFMKVLGVVGTLAMFMVGGEIIAHGMPGLDHHWLEHLFEKVTSAEPWLSILEKLGVILFGLICGAIVVGLLVIVAPLWNRVAARFKKARLA